MIYKFYIVENIVKNRLIAHCKYSIYNNSIFIHNLHVDPQFRNKNVGSNMLKKIEEYGVKKRINKFSLILHYTPNSMLLDFYKKNGYTQIKSKYNYYDDGETVYDLIKMVKTLD